MPCSLPSIRITSVGSSAPLPVIYAPSKATVDNALRIVNEQQLSHAERERFFIRLAQNWNLDHLLAKSVTDGGKKKRSKGKAAVATAFPAPATMPALKNQAFVFIKPASMTPAGNQTAAPLLMACLSSSTLFRVTQ